MSPTLLTLESRLTPSLTGLTSAQTQLTPAPGRWSIQQITEHLLLTYALTCLTFESRIAKSTPTKATPTLTQRLGQIALLNLGYFPSGRKAPSRVIPPSESTPQSGAELASTLHTQLQRLDTLITQAETLFGPRTRAITHQVLGPLTSRQWRAFHLVHALHHLKQIQRIRQAHHLTPNLDPIS